MTTPVKIPPVPVAAGALDPNSAANDDMLDATVLPQQPPPQAMNSNNSLTNESLLLEDLVKLISLPPSKDHLLKLASNVMIACIQNILSSSTSIHRMASQQRQQHPHHDLATATSLSTSESLMIAYLRAIAHHLQILVLLPFDASQQQQPALNTVTTTADGISSSEMRKSDTTFHNFNMNIDDCSFTILPVSESMMCNTHILLFSRNV
jgi:hypothetical protein